MTAPAHPSFLELDRLALGAAAAETASHARSCPECSAHLEALAMGAPMAGSLRQAASAGWLPRWPRLWRPLVPAMAVAVGLGVFVLRDPEQPDTRVKGDPAAALYVKRGEQVFLWDGVAAVAPGDRLQLQVAPEEFAFVAVGSLSKAGRWQPLYSGALEVRRPLMLPTSFAVDDQPGPEQLTVVLSLRELRQDELADLAVKPGHGREVWSFSLLLPKAHGTRP